ncbi:PulJ/GspJ family protein [Cysteiniphilum halobium]|uniref:PulJ/GspJ family protein n=1 Tax=Cysteiniphilum halobium TaxID=2219059 RepID=UPI003F8751F0
MKMNRLNKQRGLTIVETLLAIIVGVIILVAAFELFGTARDGAHLTQVDSDIMEQFAAAESLYDPNTQITKTYDIASLGVSHLYDPWGDAYTASLAVTAGKIDPTSGKYVPAKGELTLKVDSTGHGAPDQECAKVNGVASNMISEGMVKLKSMDPCTAGKNVYNVVLDLQ